MANIITTKTTKKGDINLIVNGKKAASIVAREKGHKVVVYVTKAVGTNLDIYEKTFAAKNTKKTIRANSVEVCSTYIKTNGKDPCYAILKFAPDADLELIKGKLADIAVKNNEKFAPKPEAEEAPAEEVATEDAPAEETEAVEA